MTRLLRRLRFFGACPEGIAWLDSQPDADTAWRSCPRGDWMLWLASRTVRRQDVALAACGCARLALPHVRRREDRPLAAIETVERWARGEATIAEVGRAGAAANACAHEPYAGSAHALYAAAYAAETVTWEGNFAAWVGYAVAADAAFAAGGDATTYRTARDAAWRECADIVRAHIPWSAVDAAIREAEAG